MLELPEKDHIINRARDHKREQSSLSERSSQNTLAALVVQMINLDISLVILMPNLIRDLKACSVVAVRLNSSRPQHPRSVFALQLAGFSLFRRSLVKWDECCSLANRTGHPFTKKCAGA